MAELAALVRELAPVLQHDEKYDAIASYVAEASLVTFMNRQYKGDAGDPRVQAIPRKAPAELTAFAITRPESWVVPGARLMEAEATVVGRALQAAGALRRVGEGGGTFEHLLPFTLHVSSAAIVNDDTYDAFLRLVISENRLAAMRLALGIELLKRGGPPEVVACGVAAGRGADRHT